MTEIFFIIYNVDLFLNNLAEYSLLSPVFFRKKLSETLANCSYAQTLCISFSILKVLIMSLHGCFFYVCCQVAILVTSCS